MKIQNILLIAMLVLGLSSANAFDLGSLAGGSKSAVPTDASGILKALTGSSDKLKNSLGNSSPELKDRLTNITKAATSGEDGSMLQDIQNLNGIPGANMMTEQQKALWNEVKGQSQALALTRNFSDDPAIKGPVTEAVKAVQTGDHVAAAKSLKTISDSASLSPVQKNLLKSMMGDYSKYLDSAGEIGKAAGSLKNLF